VPGAAAGAGGGLATIGYSEQTRLTPLTVGFQETQFLNTLNTENQELLQFGPPALWDEQTRQEHNVPMGPTNPQALNRYAYCLGNPLRYVDPTGHQIIKIGTVELTLDELTEVIRDLGNLKKFNTSLGLPVTAVGVGLDVAGVLGAPVLPAGIAVTVVGMDFVFAAVQLNWLIPELEDALQYAQDNGLDIVEIDFYWDNEGPLWAPLGVSLEIPGGSEDRFWMATSGLTWALLDIYSKGQLNTPVDVIE
jgi:hypothetical protein